MHVWCIILDKGYIYKRKTYFLINIYFRINWDSEIRFCRSASKKLKFSNFLMFSYRKWQNGTRAESRFLRWRVKALHFVPHCLQSAPSHSPKLRFGPEKLLNPTLFATGGNNTFASSGLPSSPPKKPRFPTGTPLSFSMRKRQKKKTWNKIVFPMQTAKNWFHLLNLHEKIHRLKKIEINVCNLFPESPN